MPIVPLKNYLATLTKCGVYLLKKRGSLINYTCIAALHFVATWSLQDLLKKRGHHDRELGGLGAYQPYIYGYGDFKNDFHRFWGKLKLYEVNEKDIITKKNDIIN